ncbi:MAG: GtrA family protein [Acidobacteriota bacterium]
MTTLHRFARFNAVGALGIGVQLTVLWVLADLWGIGYPIATVAGVSAAVTHNFLWHQRWTWKDRRPRGLDALKAFARFIGTNGAISIAGNVAVMVLLVGGAGMNSLVANGIAIAATGLVNFAMTDVVVFEAS